MSRERNTRRWHGFASCLTARRVLAVTTLAFGGAFLLASFHAKAQELNSKGVEIWHGNQKIGGKSRVIDVMQDPRSIDPDKQLALELLAEARLLSDEGEFDKAAEFARHANTLGAQWHDDEQSPSQLLVELLRKQNRLTDPNTTDNTDLAPRLIDNSRPLPSGVRPIDPYDSQGSWQTDNSTDSTPLLAPPAPIDNATTPETGTPGTHTNPATTHNPAAPIRLGEAPSLDESRDPSAANNDDSLWTAAVVQLVSTLAGVFVGIALLAGVAILAFRRYGTQLGPVFRVELVNAEGSGLAIQPVGAGSNLGATGDGESYAPIEVRDFSAEDMPLALPGQSYFDKKEQDDEEFHRKEEAILKVVFEENLELREQLQDNQRAAA